MPVPVPVPVPDKGYDMKLFDHERLDVYKVAIEFLIHSDNISQSLPRGRAYLADQLRRASLSISLNIAEGAGEFSPDEKIRFYRIAKRSATECAAILDACRVLKIADQQILSIARDMLLRIVSMLIRMTKKQ